MKKKHRLKNQKCYLCNESKFERVDGKVRDKPDIKILKCNNCGLVFLQSFDHINISFYESSKMRKNDQYKDWKECINECINDDMRRADFIKPIMVNKSILDFGCGCGGFLLNISDLWVFLLC